MLTTTTTLIGTSTTLAEVWEPMDDHATLQTINGVRMGKVGTNRPPEALVANLGPAERREAVAHWYDEQFERAHAAILAERPELASAHFRDGEAVA